MSTACSCGKDPSISFVHGNISINIGEYYEIADEDVKIENSKSEYEVIVLNEDIAELEGNKITAKKKGVTIVRFQLVDNNSIRCDIELIVTNIVYASNIDIEKDEVLINMRISKTASNRVFLNKGCTEIPEVTYNKDIISYDYLTGSIEAKSEGQTSVVVLFDGCNVSFNVRVVDVAYTTKLIVEDAIVFNNTSGVFDFQIFPYYSNTYSFFTTSELIRVSALGEYETFGVGEATIYYEYVKAENEAPTLGFFTVTILDEVDSIDVEIIEIDTGSTPSVLIEGREYRLSISAGNVPKELISISGNISYTDLVKFEEVWYTDFYFLNSGESSIVVTVEMGTESIQNVSDVYVYASQDMQIKAMWFAIVQDIPEDGKYHLYLNGDSLQPNELTFVCVVGNVIMNNDIVVYDITSGDRVLSSIYFRPTYAGEYVFEFEIDGQKMGPITIVVE